MKNVINNWTLRMLCLGALASLTVGCGGDDDDSSTDTGADTTEDGSGDTTTDTTEDGSGDTTTDTSEDTTAPPALVDECVNTADQAIIAGGTVTDDAQSCGLGCLGDAEPGACAVTCLVGRTGLSEGCAGCYGGVVVCSIQNCLAQCAADPDSEACATCQQENCLPDYYLCTGAVNQCTNEADLAILVPDQGAAAADEAQSCGLGCLGDADPGTCAGTCVAGRTGLTEGCSGCYADVVVCSIQNCLAQCAADPDSAACTTCQQENCLDTFYACRGELPSDGSGEGSGEGSGSSNGSGAN